MKYPWKLCLGMIVLSYHTTIISMLPALRRISSLRFQQISRYHHKDAYKGSPKKLRKRSERELDYARLPSELLPVHRRRLERTLEDAQIRLEIATDMYQEHLKWKCLDLDWFEKRDRLKQEISWLDRSIPGIKNELERISKAESNAAGTPIRQSAPS